MCENCDLFAIEDIIHMIMQCPSFVEEQKAMFLEIKVISPNIKEHLHETPNMTIRWLLGGTIIKKVSSKMKG